MYSFSSIYGKQTDVSSCNKRKMNYLSTYKEENTTEIRNSLIQDCIFQCLSGIITKNDVAQKLKDTYAMEKDMAEPTKRVKGEDLAKCVMRYLCSETRIPMAVQEAPVNIEGVEVMVKPDLVFYNGNELEVVKLLYRKPDITASGRTLYKNADSCLALYSLLYYGKLLFNTYLTKGHRISIKASIYFLRKSNDNYEDDVFDLDFFETKGGKNIISLSDNSLYPTSVDRHFNELFRDFKIGKDMKYDTDTCEYCERKGICAYKKTPEPTLTSVDAPKGFPKFTEAQLEAINFNKGIARLNAVPGSGKTTVISCRVAKLLMNTRPEEICVLSFTDNAAKQMTDRIASYSEMAGIRNVDLSKMLSCTFNALGEAVIKAYYSALGFTTQPNTLDEVEKSHYIDKLLTMYPIDDVLSYRNMKMNEGYAKGAVVLAGMVFDIIKDNQLQDSAESREFILNKLDADAKYFSNETIEKLFVLQEKYEEMLKKDNLIDFSDQEQLLFELDKKYPTFFQNTGLKHIIVDEFQDSNDRQMGIINLLRKSKVFESLMVVGDDAQAIYGFRGTSPKFIINFYDYVGQTGQDFFLLENHRSTQDILDLASMIIAHNKNKIPKQLISTKQQNGPSPTAKAYTFPYMEYDEIADGIERDVKAGKQVAFLARSKSELLQIQKRLDKMNVKNILLNPEYVAENPKVIACVSLFQFLNHPEDESCCAAYLNAFYQGNFLQSSGCRKDIQGAQEYVCQFQQYSSVKKREEFFRLAQSLLTESDEIYEDFLNTLSRKRTWGELSGYMQDFLIYGNKKQKKRVLDYPGVVLTTAHSAKGLEWDVVYLSVTKFDNKLIRAKSREEELEETRRLLFVAITRAKTELHITGKYYSFGDAQHPEFNIFLKEVYEALGKDLEKEYEQLFLRKAS